MPHRAEAAIVLCAGGSARMGSPKGLLDLGGRPLLARHVDAFAAWADRVIVVLGADADRYRAALPGHARVVENPDWARTWPADSLRLALLAEDVRGTCWITPADVPPARPETLKALAARGAPAIPEDAHGRPGHPVLLDPDRVVQIRVRAPDGGLRALLTEVPRVRVSDPDVALDFDDPASWAAWRAER